MSGRDQRVIPLRPSETRIKKSPSWGLRRKPWGAALGRRTGCAEQARGVDLDWLETFLAVVDRGGFTAASEQIHRSQSRVSAHIAALERQLGVRLLDRTRRPAGLTSAGEVFAPHAGEIVAGSGSGRAALGALRGID